MQKIRNFGISRQIYFSIINSLPFHNRLCEDNISLSRSRGTKMLFCRMFAKMGIFPCALMPSMLSYYNSLQAVGFFYRYAIEKITIYQNITFQKLLPLYITFAQEKKKLFGHGITSPVITLHQFKSKNKNKGRGSCNLVTH